MGARSPSSPRPRTRTPSRPDPLRPPRHPPSSLPSHPPDPATRETNHQPSRQAIRAPPLFSSPSLSPSQHPLRISSDGMDAPAPAKRRRGGGGGGGEKKDLFHVVHKVPAGDSPYVRAKHLQLVEKDAEASIVWFWKAINSGDRVDSALKDMAVVMKQQDRAEEAIEAIRSFRHLCSRQAQESLDNLLIDLYKKCGKVDEQIELLKQKLKMICLGEAFNGKITKTARSHGKKFQVSIQQEMSRILGNLGWAYMQQNNYEAAELVYRKAQTIVPDANRACNLGLCLIKQGRHEEAVQVLGDVLLRRISGLDDDKAVARAEQLLSELGPTTHVSSPFDIGLSFTEEIMERLDLVMNDWTPFRSRRLPVFEELDAFRDQMAC
ncbi:hypothetical protein VPH35_010159 [Triticum aestivum]